MYVCRNIRRIILLRRNNSNQLGKYLYKIWHVNLNKNIPKRAKYLTRLYWTTQLIDARNTVAKSKSTAPERNLFPTVNLVVRDPN